MINREFYQIEFDEVATSSFVIIYMITRQLYLTVHISVYQTDHDKIFINKTIFQYECDVNIICSNVPSQKFRIVVIRNAISILSCFNVPSQI